ncbi:hypothetical protein JTT01_19360 [Clostridium botulinum]|nr:hypothetical protein [Clostridium botulinum]
MPILEREVGWNFQKDVDCYIPTQVAKWINKSMSNELSFPIEKLFKSLINLEMLELAIFQ